MARVLHRSWLAVIATLLLSGVVSGCQYETRFMETVRPLSLSFAVTYTNKGSDVIVRYSVPAPPAGKVWVLWAYDQGRKQVAKLGEVPAGVDLTAEGSANFQVYGVVITAEDSGNVTRMVGTGIIELTLQEENPGTSSGSSGPTPGAKGTPTATTRR